MTPHYQDAAVTVYAGDCLDVLRDLPDASVDAVVTDPPYGLEFMGKAWDSFKPKETTCYTPTTATGAVPTATATGVSDATAASNTTAKPAAHAGESGALVRSASKTPAPADPARAASATIVEADQIGGFQDGNGGNAYSRSRVRTDTRRHGGDMLTANHGFQQWCEAWAAECLRVLKPGGHLLAFGGTRTWHRLACAIEDAGFEVRDSIAWLYGSGFPKSLDVSKAIDKLNGKPLERLREFGAYVRHCREAAGLTAAEVNRAMEMPQGCGWWEGKGAGSKWDLHMPSVETWARLKAVVSTIDGEWDWFVEWAEAEREVVGERDHGRNSIMGGIIGRDSVNVSDITAPATPDAERWQGWGTALKPAHEPIVVARKPLSGTVAATVLEHGTGALNIGACRVETSDNLNGGTYSGTAVSETGDGWRMANAQRVFVQPQGRWPANVILDESQAAALDQQSGEFEGQVGMVKTHGGHRFIEGDTESVQKFAHGIKDTGGASRFMYVAKADASERVRLPKVGAGNGRVTGLGGKVRQCNVCETRAIESGAGEPSCGHGDYRWEQPTTEKLDTIAHPTVKPLALMRWLVRLVTPPGGTVLEPFAGSGTTVEAAILEGFNCIAIEREPDYLPLIIQRINRRRDPVAAVRSSGEDAGLFDLLDEDEVPA